MIEIKSNRSFIPTAMVLSTFFVLMINGGVAAQDAPTPQKAPRTPVHKQSLAIEPLVTNKKIQGTATILDAERIRLDEIEIRLFGIVPPLLSAPLGPQARSYLDKLTIQDQVLCQIRDRDREGRFFATCTNGKTQDLALELLKAGLAVTARGTLSLSELARDYMAAEKQAQNKKIGLWVDAHNENENEKGMDLSALSNQTKEEGLPKINLEPSSVNAKNEIVLPEKNQKIGQSIPMQIAQQDDFNKITNETALYEKGWFEMYQIFLTGFLLSLTAIFCVAFNAYTKKDRLKKRQEEVAAALRGELMAARAVCVSRLAVMTKFQEENSVVCPQNLVTVTAWPRVRTTVFQAYVGQLGLLGSDLSRKIASIYGQLIDYAAYYSNQTAPKMDIVLASKLKALDSLVLYIDEILPRLAEKESIKDRKHPLFVAQRVEKKAHFLVESEPSSLTQNAVDVSGVEGCVSSLNDDGNSNKSTLQEKISNTAKKSKVVITTALADKLKNIKDRTPLSKDKENLEIDVYGSLTTEEMEALAYGEGPAAEEAAQKAMAK